MRAMSHDISRLQADVATSSNFFCSSLWGFVSLSPFLLSARRSVPHFPFVSLPSRVAPSRVPFVLLFLHPLLSLSFLLSIVISPLYCACSCRGMRTCQPRHAPLLHYYCNLLTTSASNLAYSMSMECRISPRVDRNNVLLLPAEYLCPWCRCWHLYGIRERFVS